MVRRCRRMHTIYLVLQHPLDNYRLSRTTRLPISRSFYFSSHPTDFGPHADLIQLQKMQCLVFCSNISSMMLFAFHEYVASCGQLHEPLPGAQIGYVISLKPIQNTADVVD